MTIVQRNLIRQECDNIVNKHNALAKEAKSKNDKMEAYAETKASNGALELMVAILQLDKEGKI